MWTSRLVRRTLPANILQRLRRPIQSERKPYRAFAMPVKLNHHRACATNLLDHCGIVPEMHEFRAPLLGQNLCYNVVVPANPCIEDSIAILNVAIVQVGGLSKADVCPFRRRITANCQSCLYAAVRKAHWLSCRRPW